MVSKKGIGVGQVFIFIVAAITFALVAIFGYKAVGDFLNKGEVVALTQFKTELESDFKEIHSEYRSVHIEQYNPPARYKSVCFVDMDFANMDLGALCEESFAACEVFKTAQEGKVDEFGVMIKGHRAASENVFLDPVSTTPIKVFDFTINDGAQKGFYCVDIVAGSFSLRLEGGGDHTKIVVE